MPEENQDDQVEEEMMRLMQEEAGDTVTGEESPEGDAPEESGTEAGADALADALADAGGEEGGEGGGGDDLESQMLAAMLQETGAEDELAVPAGGGLSLGDEDVPPNVVRLLDVHLSVSIELGRTEESINTVLEWTEGSLIELSKVSGDAVDVLVNGRTFARGEVVTIAENFGVRLTEILPRVGPEPEG